MHRIEFQSLGDLLAFLTACQTRREALGRSRDRGLYDRISIGKRQKSGKAPDGVTYNIAFSPEKWDWQQDEKNRFGGEVQQTPMPAGKEVSLNDLLLELPLISRREAIKPPSVVLAVRASEPEARKRLHEAWCRVPKLEEAESRFYEMQDGEKILWHGVEVRDVASGFDCSLVRAGSDDPVVVFAPAWRETNCHLYVEWGYSYPKAQDFASLYQGPRGGGASLLLARAGAAVPGLRRVTATWHAPEWISGMVESYSLVEEFYDLEPAQAGRVEHLIAHEVSEADRLLLPLELGSARHLIGDATEIELNLTRCSREMEELTTRKMRLVSQKQNLVFPAYTFDQAAGEEVPEKLRRLLRRPLGELARYRYFCGSVNGRWRHVVIGETPVTGGAAMAVPCDKVWLCDARWREWNLPLFVRAGAALSVPVDERGMADKVRELIGGTDGLAQAFSSDGGILLAEPMDADEGTIDEGMVGELMSSGRRTRGGIVGEGMLRETRAEGGMILTPVIATRTLDQSLQFINTADSTPALLADASSAALESEVTLPDVWVSEQVGGLDAILQDRAQLLIAELEQAWETTRTHATEALLRLRVTEAAVEAGREVCAEADQHWADFVNRVLTTDARLTKTKRDAMVRWYEDEATREKRVEEVQKSRKDFSRELEKSRTLLTASRAAFENDRVRLEKSVAELEEDRRQVEALKSQVGEASESLKRRLDETQRVLGALREEEKQCDQRYRQLEQERQAAEARTREMEARRAQVLTATQQLVEAMAGVQYETVAHDEAMARLIFAHRSASAHLPPPPPEPGWLQRLFGFRKQRRED